MNSGFRIGVSIKCLTSRYYTLAGEELVKSWNSKLNVYLVLNPYLAFSFVKSFWLECVELILPESFSLYQCCLLIFYRSCRVICKSQLLNWHYLQILFKVANSWLVKMLYQFAHDVVIFQMTSVIIHPYIELCFTFSHVLELVDSTFTEIDDPCWCALHFV